MRLHALILTCLFAAALCATSVGLARHAPEAPDERVLAEREATGRAGAKRRIFPDLSGTTLDGRPISLGDYAGTRLAVVFFRPLVPGVMEVLGAVNALAPLRADHNFAIVGVSSGASAEVSRSFAEANGLDFPILDDASGEIAKSMGLRRPVAVTLTDVERYVLASTTRFPKGQDATLRIAARLREVLRLPSEDEIATTPIDRPEAPPIRAKDLDGNEIHLASYRGRPVVVAFFLHDCPYCKAALNTLKTTLAAVPDGVEKPAVLGVEISGRPSAVKPALAADDLDFFPVVSDADWELRRAYGVFGDVPVLFLVDAEGRIVFRTKPGWDAARDPAIVTVWMAKLAGAPIPMMLPEQGYAGNDVCGACHETAYRTWALTEHASAYQTLVKHGHERDPECVGCHVVGFGEPGGFALLQTSSAPSDFENVGCESCHGRGGPHLSPGFAQQHTYEQVCVGCHDQKHSLGFAFADFLPKVSHAAIAALTPEEREARVAAQGELRNVLPTGADFVGSEACRSCHPAEFDVWANSPHATSMASLAAKGEAANPTCQRCHTTGFDRPGGFTPAADDRPHPPLDHDLSRVGCESCHGPGAEHVGESAARVGTIVSLTDKCNSCAILKVCGACHDEANDPGFAFAVDEKIEAQRHGTIRPAAEKAAEAAVPGMDPADGARSE